MNILVTGGAGYIGSHTILELIDAFPGATIISVDNFLNSSDETFDRIEEISQKRMTERSIQFLDVI